VNKTDKPYISEDESAGYASPVLDIIAAIAISCLSIWVMVESVALKTPAEIATAPGLLPFLTAGSLMLMAIVLALSALRRHRSAPAAMTQDIPEDLPRAGLLIAILIAYVAALDFIEFSRSIAIGPIAMQVNAFEPVSIVVLTAILRIFWTPRLWACVLVAVIWILLLTVTFQSLMTIPMPG
jgi:hypothetical protein